MLKDIGVGIFFIYWTFVLTIKMVRWTHGLGIGFTYNMIFATVFEFLTWQSKSFQEVPEGFHELHAGEVHLVDVVMHRYNVFSVTEIFT